MKTYYNVNGLPFFTEREIRLRRQFAEHFAAEVRRMLLRWNKAWSFYEIEAPILTPRNFVNKNYTNEDIWVQQQFENEVELVLRPETTPGSYLFAEKVMEAGWDLPPLCVYQTGKSFRREQDNVSKNCRYKEFYQQEFQCIFTSDTANDYHALSLEEVKKMLAEVIGLPARVVESDRLPSYSLKTMDVEVDNGDKWMEVASISKRTDFPSKAKYTTKKGTTEKDLLVLEIAIGLDRIVYNFEQRVEKT